MKIERLKVEGFGHFRQFELELKPGLNVLYGPNEAGKSTLLAFVRAVLFGFEGRKEIPADPPGGYRPHPGTGRETGRSLSRAIGSGFRMHAPAGAPPWPVPDSGSSSLLDRQYRVSSTALRTRSFWNMRARWASIVRCVTPSSAAMYLLDRPCVR